MVLDHERLDVYLVALDFLVFANEVIERLPRGRGHLADQLTRASTSIVLNLAEGAGKLSKADKRRYYLTARGSATSPPLCREHRFDLPPLPLIQLTSNHRGYRWNTHSTPWIVSVFCASISAHHRTASSAT
jgi:hypothetical protein